MKPIKDHKVGLLIPSYNTGKDLLVKTVEPAVQKKIAVFVLIDGSTDGSGKFLTKVLEPVYKNLTVIHFKENKGKGETVLRGARIIKKQGYTHILTMDADGQHPAESIPALVQASEDFPESLIMGQPVFGDEAPWARVYGRKLTSFFTSFETLYQGLGDTLFGMRIYPIDPMLKAFSQTSFARGFDFDPEIAVRITWLGISPKPIDVPVKYLSEQEGGISHFNYIRDNILLFILHLRLIPELIFFRIFSFLPHRFKKPPSTKTNET